MDRREELLESSGVEVDGLERRRVREGFVHRIERGRLQLFRRRDPDETLAFRILQPGVVRHLAMIHLDELLVVEQQLRHQGETDIVEIADPSVAVLEPDLDDLEIDRSGRQHGPGFALQIGHAQLDALLRTLSVDQERRRLELPLRRDHVQLALNPAVLRIGVRQAPHVAHRRHGIPGQRPLGEAGGLQGVADTPAIHRRVSPGPLGLGTVDGVVRVVEFGLRCGGGRRADEQRGGGDRTYFHQGLVFHHFSF